MSSIIVHHNKINEIMVESVIPLYEFLKSPECLLTIAALSFALKIYFIASLIPHGYNQPKVIHPWAFLLSTIASSMFSDLAWIIKLARTIMYPGIPYALIVCSIRIAWAFLVIQHQSFSFFIQSIVHKKFRLSLQNKVMLIISSLFSGYFLYLGFFDFNINATEAERKLVKALDSNNEFFIMQIATLFILIFLIIPALYHAYSNMHSYELPKIIRKQLKQFILFFITPYLLVECLLGVFTRSINSSVYPIVSLSSFLLVCAIHYCLKKVMLLRFLNIHNHVQGAPSEHTLEDFKSVLERLSSATNLHELSHITQSFFKNSFGVHTRHVQLTIRNLNQETTLPINQPVEQMLHGDENQELLQALNTQKIIIRDEIEFNKFYTNQPLSITMINFLNSIDAEIFLPIYMQNTMIAYITVAHHVHEKCYTQSERDTLLVFASYIGNSINILQQQDLNVFIYNEKKLKDQLYLKHQEINQYKESINTFLRHHKEKEIGIIFYKNNQFVFGNTQAQELLSPAIITQEGHPLYQALKHVATHVKNYNTPCTQFAHDGDRMLILSGVPHLEQNNVIITIVYPDISDVINKKMHQLQDHNNWHYLLYLESTKIGKHINQLIPGHGELLLHYKIEFLKAALSKSSLLLDMPEQDVMPAVELLHHISLRDTLHTITLTAPTKHEDIATKLFGINQLLAPSQDASLFKKLHDIGTLLIQNVHYLDLETQKALATFIQYGFYTPYKSEHPLTSSVRIISTSTQNIAHLVQNKNFNSDLYTALKPVTLSMPSMLLLPPEELYSLIDGFTDQAIKSHAFKNLLSLTDKEKEKIVTMRPSSMYELKLKIQHLLIKKSKESNISQESIIDRAYHISDPALINAARLGKQALKDPKIMDMLWHKFKNQNKIALFLGVNRSSIHRRFKIIDTEEKEMHA